MWMEGEVGSVEPCSKVGTKFVLRLLGALCLLVNLYWYLLYTM